MYKALLVAKKAVTFNIKQQKCFERVISVVDSVREETWPYFFIEDPAGRGKTFLDNVLCYYYCAYEKIVLCIASSSVISLLLLGGRRSYPCLQIPLNIYKSLQYNIDKNSKLGDFLYQVILLIWDKVLI